MCLPTPKVYCIYVLTYSLYFYPCYCQGSAASLLGELGNLDVVYWKHSDHSHPFGIQIHLYNKPIRSYINLYIFLSAIVDQTSEPNGLNFFLNPKFNTKIDFFFKSIFTFQKSKFFYNLMFKNSTSNARHFSQSSIK